MLLVFSDWHAVNKHKNYCIMADVHGASQDRTAQFLSCTEALLSSETLKVSQSLMYFFFVCDTVFVQLSSVTVDRNPLRYNF